MEAILVSRRGLVRRGRDSNGRRWQAAWAAPMALAVGAVLPACGRSSGPQATGAPATTVPSPTSAAAPATASPSGPSPTTPIFPRRRSPGEPPLRCSVHTTLLGPLDRAPEGTSPAEVAAFSFPPPDALAEERPVTDLDVAGFIAAFRARRHFPEDIIFVVAPGSARAAYMPSTGQHWGLASFTLPPGVKVDPNRGGEDFYPPKNMMVFVQPPGCPWTGLDIAFPFPCPNAEDLPLGVQRAWQIQAPPKEACDHLSRHRVR